MTAVIAPPALTETFAGWGAVDVSGLLSTADLQARFDTKYVVAAEALGRVAAALDGRMRVLEVDGRRSIGHRTIYFDTPDLVTYRMHVQRRRRRYKIRTRTYLGQHGTMLEVKTRDKAGRTIKHRLTHPAERPHELPEEAVAFVERTLVQAYGFALPGALGMSATTRYWRTTLLDAQAGERLTVDLGLTAEMRGRRAVFDGGHAVLEIKAPTRHGHIEGVFRRLGIRPLSVSKYCVAVAVLEPDRPSNRWRPAVRRLCASPPWQAGHPLDPAPAGLGGSVIAPGHHPRCYLLRS